MSANGCRLMGRHEANSDVEEAKFNFTRLEDLEGSAKPLLDSQLASSLTRSHWPQSYEKSMGCLYSRFPNSRSFLLQHTEQIPDFLLNGADGSLSEAKLPLIDRPLDFEDDEANTDAGPHLDFTHCATQHHIQHTSHASQQQGQSSFFQAVLNGTNILAGIGILSMPYAVSQGGWIGVSFLVIFAAICCYTGFLLRRCLDLAPHIHGFPDVGQAAFGRWGRFFISAFLYCELFSVAVEFLILEGDNLTQLFSWEGLDFGLFQLTSAQALLILSAALMLPTVWVRDLSLLSYISAGGVVSCVVLLLAVAWVGISGAGFTNSGHLLSVQGFPIAVGLYAFCYCGHAVFPSIYGSMRDKTKFSHVLVVCFVLCAFIYGGMAVLGFLVFGDASESQVTLNLPRGKFVTYVAVGATLANPFAKYALTIAPLAAALEELLPARMKALNFARWGVIIRTILVVSTVAVALVVPFFAYLMALVGSFLSITMAISIPCICYLNLFSGRIPLWERMMIFIFLALGLIACVAGTYSALLEIVKDLSSN